MAGRPRLGSGSTAVAAGDALLPVRAVQFGTGAFLRGFVDDFLDRANKQGTFNGRVVAIGSTGSHRDQALRQQDGLYTLVVRGVEQGNVVNERRVVRSLASAVSAADSWDAVLELARLPELAFVFSNTTEVGIRESNSDRFEDAPPASFPAKLTRFLYERAQAFEFNGRDVVVIPCELVENNGDKLREIVTSLAKRWAVDSRFAPWLDINVRFCNTLVDRIVPGTPSGSDYEQLANELGYDDALLTCCEPYRLFAIEGDAALQALLPWSKADAGIVVARDITPFRARKLYLLNGAHTVFVSVALLAGHTTVADAMADPEIAAFVRRAMLDEVAPTLAVDGAREFGEAVLDRFRNPFIRHALLDITLQATMKMRVRVIPSIERYVAEHAELPQALTFGFAAFLLLKRDQATEAGRPDEQGAAISAAWARHAGNTRAAVDEICSNTTLWGTDLAALPCFASQVSDHIDQMSARGVRAVMPATLTHHTH